MVFIFCCDCYKAKIGLDNVLRDGTEQATRLDVLLFHTFRHEK